MSSKRKKKTVNEDIGLPFVEHRKRCKPLADSDNSSEEDITVRSDLSSSGEDFETESKTSRRKSTRSKRSFHMPSREEIWDKIPSTPSGIPYTHLKPRKLINNFTAENSRYNYDPAYTSGEDSIQDFVVSSDEYLNEKQDKTYEADETSSYEADETSSDEADDSETAKKNDNNDSDSCNNNNSLESEGSSNEFVRKLKKKQQKKRRIRISFSCSDSESSSSKQQTKTVHTVEEDIDNKAQQLQESLKYRALKNYLTENKIKFRQLRSEEISDSNTSVEKNSCNSDEFNIESDSESSSSLLLSDDRNCGKSLPDRNRKRKPRLASRDKHTAAKELFAEFKVLRKKREKKDV